MKIHHTLKICNIIQHIIIIIMSKEGAGGIETTSCFARERMFFYECNNNTWISPVKRVYAFVDDYLINGIEYFPKVGQLTFVNLDNRAVELSNAVTPFPVTGANNHLRLTVFLHMPDYLFQIRVFKREGHTGRRRMVRDRTPV